MRARVIPVYLACLSILAPVASAESAAPSRTQADFREIVRQAKDKVFPAVVFIKCIREGFEAGKRRANEVSGSGVIISPAGEVLTNWHVIDHAREVRCLLLDGRAFEATVVGSDKDTDLALIQLKLPDKSQPTPCSKLGASAALQEGDFVMAMGAPWGMNRSVSIGIVSCARRFIPEHSEYSLWLQTDASISPGNSGGPLVNTAGETIGINARGSMLGGDVGFAIPSETIEKLLPWLRKHGRAMWSYTGLQFQPLHDFSRNIYFDATDGVIVAGVEPESPARRAGIQPRDRIVRINGEAITAVTEEDLPDVRIRFGMQPNGKPIALKVFRGSDELDISLTPREKGKVEGEELDCPRWNLTAKAINQFDNPALYLHRKRGIFVFGTEYPGNAVSAGLRTQDILLKINDRELATLDDLRTAYEEALKHMDDDPRVMISVLRDGLMHQIVLEYSTDFDKE